MANLPGKHEPLALIHNANAGNPDDNARLVLNTNNIEQIIQKTGSRPISVYTIVGPRKTGKSLAFAYMVKYLTAMEKEDHEWINWDEETNSCTELPWLSRGSIPDTPGIWCYPRPFILEDDRQKGNEVAVILLYAQSSNKSCWTDDKNSAAIAGLSFLSSSSVIVNVRKELNEQVIANIGKFAVTSLCVEEKLKVSSFSKDRTPLQNITMLVRDWAYPSDFAYGVSGGKEYLKVEKLQEKVSQQRESRLGRQLISNLFQKTSTCLLPYPGNEVVKPRFTGSLKDMDRQFVEYLRDFVVETIDVDDLAVKKNSSGASMTGIEWKCLIVNYISAIDAEKQEALDARAVLKQVGHKQNFLPGDEKNMIKTAVQVYGKYWIKKCNKDTEKIVSKTELDSIHQSGKKRALKSLKNEIFPTDADNSEEEDPILENFFKKTEKQLKQILEDRFKISVAEKMQDQLLVLKKLKEDIILQYKNSMMLAYPPEGKPPSVKLVNSESETHIFTAKQRFQEKLGTSPTPEASKAFQSFILELQETEENIVGQILHNKESKGESDAYRKTSHDQLATSNIEDFQENSIKFEKDICLSHSGLPSIPDTTNISINRQNRLGKANSLNTVEPSSRKTREQKRKEDEAMKERAKQLISDLRAQYLVMITTEFENEETDLDAYHIQQNSQFMAKYHQNSPFENNSQEYKLYGDLLEDELGSVLSHAKSVRRQANKAKQSGIESLISKAIFRYEEQVDQYLEDHPRIPLNQIQQVHEKFLNPELDHLEGQLNRQEFVKAKEKVADSCIKILEKIKNKLQRGKSVNENKLKCIISNLKTEYGAKLTPKMNQFSSETELQSEHESLKKDLLHKLTVEAGNIDSSQRTELTSGIDQQFAEIRTIFKQKLKGDAGSQKLAIQKAREYYKAEMDKQFKNHDYIEKVKLHEMHRKISDDALRKCPKNMSIDQKEKFKTEVDNLFKMYQDENNMNMNVDPAIGIDLGTTFSCVAIYQKGEVKIIPNSEGKLTTPSYVLFQSSGEEIIGNSAKERAYENPEGTIFDAKRILGRKFDDPKLQEDMKLWPFTVVDGGRGIPMIQVNDKKMNPEEISAKVLTQLKKDAEAYLKRPVTNAVITVPAYFVDGQKQATIDAGKMAGLEHISVLTEPVAAAMAYRLQYATGVREGSGTRHILVFDLGGGTFDVAVLKTCEGKIDVLTVDGDTHLGGEDFDKNLMDYCASEFKKKENIDLVEGKDSPNKTVRDQVRRTLKRLQAECERQKIVLASSRSATVQLNNIYKNKDMKITITRQTFEKINANLFEKTIQVVESALKQAKLSKGQIDDIVLVGGSTRIPKVQSMLRDYFNGKELDKKINPDEAVAHGAGLVAAIRKGNVEKTSTAFTKIQDVTPMSIGVEVYGGGFNPIIPKSTKIPVMLKEKYRTAHNNQTSVQITIFEGEDKIAVNNKHLGDFYLNGIPPKDAGVENIDVEMVINEQGILHVTASVSSTGAKNSVTVKENKQRMGQAAIRKYIAEKASRGS